MPKCQKSPSRDKQMFDLKRTNVPISTIIGIRYYVNQIGENNVHQNHNRNDIIFRVSKCHFSRHTIQRNNIIWGGPYRHHNYGDY